MFRLSSLSHHHVVSLCRGDHTMCNDTIREVFFTMIQRDLVFV